MSARRADLSFAAQRILVFLFGLVFLAAIVAIAVWVPHPTDFQSFVFRIVLALAAAGAAAMFPGLFEISVHTVIRVGGALFIFCVIYFINPTRFVSDAPKQKEHEGFLSALQAHLNKETTAEEFRLSLGGSQQEPLQRFWIAAVTGKTWSEVFRKICNSYEACLRCDPSADAISTNVKIEISGPVSRAKTAEGATKYSCGAEESAEHSKPLKVYIVTKDRSSGPYEVPVPPTATAATVARKLGEVVPAEVEPDLKIPTAKLFDIARDEFVQTAAGPTSLILTDITDKKVIRADFERLAQLIAGRGKPPIAPAPATPPKPVPPTSASQANSPAMIESSEFLEKLQGRNLARAPREGEATNCVVAGAPQEATVFSSPSEDEFVVVGRALLQGDGNWVEVSLSAPSADCIGNPRQRINGQVVVPAICFAKLKKGAKSNPFLSVQRDPEAKLIRADIAVYESTCLRASLASSRK